MDTQTRLPILYSFRRCPYAIRVRMALYHCKVECELREVVLKNKPQAMLDASPKGTVPVLILTDNMIDESLEIMDWALKKHSVPDWHADELKHDLVVENDGEFKLWLDQYKYFDRYPEYSQQYYFQQTLVFLSRLEAALVLSADNEFYLLSPTRSVIDVAIFPFVRQLAFVDKQAFDALDMPKLHRWFVNHLNSELFTAVMQKYPAWEPGQAPLLLTPNQASSNQERC